ncbi:uncharacterized protein V2V93DRAFT_372324 [Kockiozyma suomiensis]|uniref:uncharacterized protein n=1 Tax=Kockiozyma suomiensis TaxID=1337062 RepID=UPI003342EBDB
MNMITRRYRLPRNSIQNKSLSTIYFTRSSIRYNSTLSSSSSSSTTTATAAATPPRERFSYLRWNWVWGYVILLALVGSANINIMRQKHIHSELQRTYAKKIDALERVIEKIKDGKSVNVVEELGTGIAKEESEWKELLSSLEESENEMKAIEEQRGVVEEKTKKAAKLPKNVYL